MDEIERLFILRIKDPDARAIIRGRIGSIGGAAAVTPNIWELAKSHSDDPDATAEWWDEELKRFEETIDPRTDVIYMWVCTGGSMIRVSIGEGGE
jgi:hypothetical protein